MKNLKKIVKEDLTNNLDVSLSFDTSKLEVHESSNKKVSYKPFLIAGICSLITILLIPTAFILAIGLNFDDSFKSVKKTYSIHELNNIENKSFRSLNSVTYPDEFLKHNELDKQFVDGYNDFSYDIYINSNIHNDNNFAFSPATLYSNLSMISLANNNLEIKDTLNDILNSDEELRKTNYKGFYENNYYANKSGTTQMYNGVFMSNNYEYNEAFINNLSPYYAEAFSLDFNNEKDVNKLLSWIDQKVNSDNYLDKKQLQLDDNSAICFVSTMYFDNEWSLSFDEKYSYEDDFYVSLDEAELVTFMNHEYYGDIYDYGSYVSVYDSYTSNRKIQYLVPKSLSDDINDLLKDVNFLKEDESKLLLDENGESILIDLHLPKYSNSNVVDFKNVLSKKGLAKIFEKESKALNNAFKNLKEDEGIYLNSIFQKNEISFTESGTTIKSVNFSLGAGAAGPGEELDTYIVKLNQPFVYVIYDDNNMPLFIGNVDCIN